MHELSIALEVCRLAEERLGDASRQLRMVAVEIGEQCGLEPSNLSFCLDALLSEPPFGSGRSTIHTVAGNDLRLEYLEVDDGRPDD